MSGQASRRLLCLALLIAILAPGPVFSDGGYVTEKTVVDLATSADQIGVIVQTGDTISMTLSTGYSGKGDDFAWVIPVPGSVDAAGIAEITDAPIDQLDLLTAPRFIYEYDSPSPRGGCFGCGGSGGDSGPDAFHEGQLVTVITRLVTQTYEIVVLAAADAATLLTWLDTNGYQVDPAAATTLQLYIDGGWNFVVVKIRPEELRDFANEFLPPLCIKFQHSQMVFPLRISSVSTAGETRIKLFVIAQSVAESSNFTTRNLVYEQHPYGSPDPEAYIEQAMRDTLAGDTQAMVAIWAGPLDDIGLWPDLIGRAPLAGEQYYLTRLETMVLPEHMTEDVLIGPAAQNDGFKVLVTVYDYYASLPVRIASAFAFPGVAVGVTFVLARRRARGGIGKLS